jgi:regulator of protease activity HflC (stomatin/prohibitin superfamily)
MEVAKPSDESSLDSPSRWKKKSAIILFVVLLLLLVIVYAKSLFYIKPNQFGIKEVKIGFKRGIQKKVYTAGYNFVMPFQFERMHVFPRNIQVLELTDSQISKTEFVRQEKAVNIQTSDGFFVVVDVSMLYKITDPYLVFTTIGPGKLYEDNGIIPKAEPILKQTLGDLTTEEFYNSPLRVSKSEEAKRIFNEELNPKGIVIDHVLIRYFIYSEEIQKNIEERKLKDQQVFKNQAEARAATEAAKLKKVIEEGKATFKVKLEEGRAYRVRRIAEKDLYSRAKKAEADLLVRTADAKKAELRNQALMGPGADRLVAFEMADVYRGLEVVILPSDGKEGINPLDLNKTLKLFELRP